MHNMKINSLSRETRLGRRYELALVKRDRLQFLTHHVAGQDRSELCQTLRGGKVSQRPQFLVTLNMTEQSAAHTPQGLVRAALSVYRGNGARRNNHLVKSGQHVTASQVLNLFTSL